MPVGAPFTIFTYATDISKAFRLLRSAEKHGIFVVNLWQGEQWAGLMQKLHAFATALKTERGLVLFLDAYDTILTGGYDEILTRYAQLGAPPVCFSAEANCFPLPDLAPQFFGGKWRYPNAGACIGEAKALRALFDKMQLLKLPAEMNDQSALLQYCARFGNDVALDTNCILFQSLFLSECDISLSEGRLINTMTRSRPVIWHGNGGSDMSLVGG